MEINQLNWWNLLINCWIVWGEISSLLVTKEQNMRTTIFLWVRNLLFKQSQTWKQCLCSVYTHGFYIDMNGTYINGGRISLLKPLFIYCPSQIFFICSGLCWTAKASYFPAGHSEAQSYAIVPLQLTFYVIGHTMSHLVRWKYRSYLLWWSLYDGKWSHMENVMCLIACDALPLDTPTEFFD